MRRANVLLVTLAAVAIACAGTAPSSRPVVPSPPPSVANPAMTVSPRPPSSIPAPSPDPSPTSAAPAVLVGAGDIADCSSTGDEETARLLDKIDGTVFTAGDNAYPKGRPDDFRRCYVPSWGRHVDRTLPAPGNHDHDTAAAAGYRAYFGARARPEDRTWYSIDIDDWHVVVLDSECGKVGGCDAGSVQGRWLRDDLASSGALCTLAIWHKPRFSSGEHGSDRSVAPLWEAAYGAAVDLVVNGHDHDYERFAPQDPTGHVDEEGGIRQIVVGTGGAHLREVERPVDNSEVRDDTSHGVLKLTLRATGYDWEFVPVAGDPFRDSGSASCH